MHYWNKSNFEGLADLAEELGADARLASLAEYCRLREQGLRRDALAALERFLGSGCFGEPDVARAATIRILELHARTPQAHQFLAQPLLHRFLIPTLHGWLEAEPASSIPARWLGILNRDAPMLRRALAASPEDLPVRRLLADLELSEAEYATHHLVESRFIGDPAAAQAALVSARALVEGALQAEAVSDLLAEIEHHVALISDWLAYRNAPEGTFPEWCNARGRSYKWPTVVYYGEGAV